MMTIVWLLALALTWALVLLLGFLLLGALRAQGLLEWRLEQLAATMPSRIGRSGLAPGNQAPDFSLPCVGQSSGRDPDCPAGTLALRDFAGRKVLLVFVQSGCGPCHDIVPELNKLATRDRGLQILAINHATPQAACDWAVETRAVFPVLVQEDWSISKKYEAFATPFAFVIDDHGVIASKGIVTQPHHLGYVLAQAAQYAPDRGDPEVAPQVSGKASISAAATL